MCRSDPQTHLQRQSTDLPFLLSDSPITLKYPNVFPVMSIRLGTITAPW